MAEAIKINSRSFAQLTGIPIPSLVYEEEIPDLSDTIDDSDDDGLEYC